MSNVTLNDITSGYNLSKINDNFDKLENAVNNEILHTTGGNNTMGQQLDMNNKRIINLPAPSNPTDPVRLQEYQQWVDTLTGVEGVVPIVQDRQYGDGSTLIFNAPHTAASGPQSFFVYIDGVAQRPVTDYDSVVIGEINFYEAPYDGAVVDITYFEPQVTTDPEFQAVLDNANLNTKSFDSLEDFRASTYGYNEAIILAANSGTTTGRMVLKATGTTGGTPTTTGNRFLALAAGEIINEGGYGYELSTDQIVTSSMFGAVADYSSTKTDNLAAFQAFLNFCPGKKVKVDPGSYYFSGELTCAGDDIDIDASGAKFYVDGASSSTGFVFGSSATDSEPNYFNFKWCGGEFFSDDGEAGTLGHQFLRLYGIQNFDISGVTLNHVANGGIQILSGCRDGLIEGVSVESMSSYSTVRGIWLNGSDASDYQSNLVDNSSITRNGNALPVGGIRNVTIRKCKVKIDTYNIYLMNAQGTVIEDCDLDEGEGTQRCITVNTYSPYTRILNNRFNSSATTGNKAILITQYSHDVLIKGNIFEGDWGTAQTIHVTYLAEVDIVDNHFLTDNPIPIISEMGASGRVSGNTFKTPVGAAKTTHDRCMRIYTIGNSEVTLSGYGDTATILNGWIFTDNKVHVRNMGVQVTQQTSLTTGNIPGIADVVVKDNFFYNWDTANGSQEYPLYIESVASPDETVRYSCYDNICSPSSSSYLAKNIAYDNGGTGVDIKTLNQMSSVSRTTFTIDVMDGSESASEGQTYSLNQGRAERRGNMVYWSAEVTMSSLGTLTTSNNVIFDGLPWKVKNSSNSKWPVFVTTATGLSLAAGASLSGYTVLNTTKFRLNVWDAATGTTSLLLSELTSSGSLELSGMYETDDNYS